VAIAIAASDVVLELGGHRLDGTGGSDSSAVGISALDRCRVTICNGTISGSHFGIDLRRSRREAAVSSGHRIEGVRLERNWYFGIRLEGGQSKVTACELRDTGGCTRPAHAIPHGIRLVGPGNTLEECRVLDLRMKRWEEEKGEIVGVHFDDARGGAMRGCNLREEAGTTDEVFPDASTRPRRFGVWVNGGPDGDTFLKVNGSTFTGFDVALAFSRGTDGEVKGNTFEAIRFDPIRGAPARQLEQNQIR
jgi:Right handed beta helix region